VASIISNFLAVFKTDASELPPAVRFVPAPYLFIHAEPLPDGMQASELDGFASVTLEGLAPLPLEQLAWGYLTNEKSRHLLIFGAFQDRLHAEGLAPEESFFQVLPSFFAAAPAGGNPQWVFIWEAGHVSAIHYGAGETIPSRVEIERLKEDTVAEAFAGRENLLKRLGSQARAEAAPGLLAQPESVRGARDRLTFSFAHYADAEAAPTRVPGHAPSDPNDCWLADLRGSYFRAAEQRRRRATATAGVVLKLAALAAVICFIGQAGVFYGKFWLNKTQNTITSRAPDVDLVNQRIKLLTQISNFVDHELHPFEMLGVLNPYRPTKDVYYVKVRAYENNKLSIDCIATNVTAIPEFMDSLANSGIVTVDRSNPNIASNPLANPPQYKFTLNLAFNTVPANEEMPPEPPPPAPEPTPPEPGMAADLVQPEFNNPNGAASLNQPDQQNPAPDAGQAADAGPTVITAPSGPTVITATPEAPAPTPTPVAAPDVAPAPDAAAAQ
jgi:hypothetical protein